MVVELRHSGVSGFGEAQPIDRYQETAESAQTYIEEHAELLGEDPFALEDVFARLPAREFAARAALDAAFHDLQGKLLGQPVWRLLGLRRAGPPTSWTVWLGDPDDMARRAEKALGRFRRLKLKLGGRDGVDVERGRAVRGVASDLPLQVDVNEAWSFEESLESLPPLAELGVEYCEQPLPAGDPGGPQLKERSPLPIYVDEDCHTLRDVPACAERVGVLLDVRERGLRRLVVPRDRRRLTEAGDAGMTQLNDERLCRVARLARDDERLRELERHDPRRDLHGGEATLPLLPRACSSGDRARASGARGRRFDSCQAHPQRRSRAGSA